MIDVRCSARLPRGSKSSCQCQLFAGHDGPHAVMFARCNERLVRTWHAKDAGAAVDSDALQRPWTFGFPTPAWFESDADASG
jgi:hypothetical protein